MIKYNKVSKDEMFRQYARGVGSTGACVGSGSVGVFLPGKVDERNANQMNKEEKVVDYLDLMARQAEEESKKDWSAKLPEPQGDQAVDYLAVAAAWEEERNRRGV